MLLVQLLQLSSSDVHGSLRIFREVLLAVGLVVAFILLTRREVSGEFAKSDLLVVLLFLEDTSMACVGL